ncbi:MAG: hypothetical protein CM15mP120_12450 [Pseudomonadota bacterium]|nr:MAG: hypothetical protein CM15mP120_12450 [Pseudomonadota bacterium]
MGVVALFYIGLVFSVLAPVCFNAFCLREDAGQIDLTGAGAIAQTAFDAGLQSKIGGSLPKCPWANLNNWSGSKSRGQTSMHWPHDAAAAMGCKFGGNRRRRFG